MRSGPASALTTLPDVRSVELYVPTQPAEDPFLKDEDAPLLIVQMRFDDVAAAQAATATDEFGRGLEALARLGIPGWRILFGAMRGVLFPGGGESDPTTSAVPVPYLVHYRRPADDEQAFIDHYLAHHPPLLAELPAIRRLEIYAPVDMEPPPTLERDDVMLICDVSFDSVESLNAALASEVRVRLRADYDAFPPFDGPVSHHAMLRTQLFPGHS